LVVSWLLLQRVLVGKRIVAYVDVDVGHTWTGEFLSEDAMACIAICNGVFSGELFVHDLGEVAAFSGTFVDAEYL
jgi:hypothetical protein